MSMDFDLPFTPLNDFLQWAREQLSSTGGTGSAE